ncbi:T9SS type A sorting domain-containing protein [Flavisolibacter sp. BT320]|nr:T9SS type A sorting domain-containing protein [Flavisolibacter longurius]
MKRLLLFSLVLWTHGLNAQKTAQFISLSENGWVTAANWSTFSRPGATDIASFGLLPSGSGSNNGCVINFNDPSFAAKELAVGAIRVLPVRLQDMNIGNASPNSDGTLVLNGLTINNIPGVVVDNQMPLNALNLKEGIVGNNRLLNIALGQEAVFLGVPGSTTEISAKVSVAGNVTVNGGTLKLARTSGFTFPETTNFKVASGTLRISTNQVINDLDLAPGSILQIDDNATLTVTGNFYQRGATILKTGTGKVDYTASGTLEYVGLLPQTVSSIEWPVKGGPKDVLIENKMGVILSGDRTVSGSISVNGLLVTGTHKAAAGTVTVNSGGMIKVGSTSSQGAFEGAFGSAKITLKEGSWVEYNGAGRQYLSGLEYQNLFIDNHGFGLTLAGDATVKGELKVDGLLELPGATKIDLAGKALTLGGTVNGLISYRGSAESGLNIATKQGIGTLHFDQDADGTSNALSQLSISSGAAVLGGKLHLFTRLNVAGGSIDLDNKNLVLKSTAQKTAYVAEIKGTLKGETNVTVERFSPAWSGRRYRLMTAPVLNTTINDAWQEGDKWNGNGSAGGNGYGTLITGQSQGSAANANKNGFDFWSAIAGGQASVRVYVPSSSASGATWQGITSTLTPNAFDNHEAYLVFIRGDRSVATGTTAGAATLRGNGKLKRGSFTIPVPAKQSHTLVGNPYAAPLDFKLVYDGNNTKIQPHFWAWQAGLGTGTGGYVLVRPVSPGSSLYEAIPGDGSKSVSNRLIHSGEGVFLLPAKDASTTNAITIQEAHKATGTPTISIFRQMGTDEPAKIYVNMLTTIDGNKALLDGIMAEYSATGSSTGVGKSANATENLSILRNSSDMIVTGGPLPAITDTLKLRLWNTVTKDYQLAIRTDNFTGTGLAPVLVDRYLQTETPVSTGSDITYHNFQVTADAGSRNQQRFYISFQKNITLPLVITSIHAEVKPAGNVAVNWRAADETGITSYQVERSFDGNNFTTLATLAARVGSGDQSYAYLDSQASLLNYYRVRMTGTAGEVKYSSIVKTMLPKNSESFTLYPNPVRGSNFNLQFLNKQKGTYTLNLYTITGQVVMTTTILHRGGTATELVTLAESVRPGNYKLEVKSETGLKEFLTVSLLK